MADWRDGLRQGMWRDVPFYFRDASNPAGQELAVFKMPETDSVYVQALGRGIKEYRLEIYVAGDDYMDQRDALEAAFDADGPGTLVHPTKGELQVYCRYPASLKETAERGRACFVEAIFVESGTVEPPVPAEDTAETAQAAADDTQAELAADYDPSYDGESTTTQGAFTGALAAVQGAIGDTLGAAAAALGDVQAVVGGALATVGSAALQLTQDLADLAGIAPDAALGYAEELGTLLSDYVGNIVDTVASLGLSDPSLAPGYQWSSRLPALPADPSYGLAGLAQAVAPLAPVGATGTILANWTALTGLVQGSATVALAKLYAQTAFTSSGDAVAARDQLAPLLDTQLAAASTDALRQAWRGLYTAAVNDLTARAAALPGLATVTTPAPMPALALAQLLYHDGTQAAALVQRNAAPHPLFMPRTVEYLEQ